MKKTNDLKGYCRADGTHWYWNDKEVAVIDERTSEIEWCCRTCTLPDEIVQAVRERKPKHNGKWIVEAKRIDHSVTQGEILITINGHAVVTFADEKYLKDEIYVSSFSDEDLGSLVVSAFWRPYDGIYHLSDWAKKIFNPKADGKRIPNPSLYVETPVGKLHAYPAIDPDYPGIYIDLERDGKRAGAPLLALDFSHTEFPECKNPEMAEKGVLVCRCWQDVRQEDYKEKDRTVFTGYDEFFAAQPDEPEESK